jgi:hypothetical protein
VALKVFATNVSDLGWMTVFAFVPNIQPFGIVEVELVEPGGIEVEA